MAETRISNFGKDKLNDTEPKGLSGFPSYGFLPLEGRVGVILSEYILCSSVSQPSMVKTKVSDSPGAQACPDSTTWKELTHQFLDKSELNSSIAHMHIFPPHCALRYTQSRSIGSLEVHVLGEMSRLKACQATELTWHVSEALGCVTCFSCRTERNQCALCDLRLLYWE